MIEDCTGRPDPLSAGVTCITCGYLIELHEHVFPTFAPDERQAWVEMLSDVLANGARAPVILICESPGGGRISVSPILDTGEPTP